jgi:hypothetical protein
MLMNIFLVGIVEKIGVRTIDSQTHQLDLTFKIPMVGDKLVWKDPKSKSKGGYETIEGESSTRGLVDSGKLKKRKRSPVEVICLNKTTPLLLNRGLFSVSALFVRDDYRCIGFIHLLSSVLTEKVFVDEVIPIGLHGRTLVCRNEERHTQKKWICAKGGTRNEEIHLYR